MTENKYVIAVDGGGTKTDLALAYGSGAVVGSVRLGASNPNDVGMEKSLEVLSGGINALLSDRGLFPADISAVFAGLSGGITGGNAPVIKKALEGVLPKAAVAVTSDASNCISSGIGHADGCCLISGTGSSAFARKNGELYQCGGWGYLIDDAGSGFAIGKEALNAYLRESDGRGEKTLITSLVDERLGCPLRKKLDLVYRGGKTAVASFAPLVFEAFDAGDGIAAEIVKRAASELALMVRALSVYYDSDYTVVLCGGILDSHRVLRDLMIPEVPKEAKLIYPEHPPIYGAVAEACALL